MNDEDEVTPVVTTIACTVCGMQLPLELAGAWCDGAGVHTLGFRASILPPPQPSPLDERERERELERVYGRAVRNMLLTLVLVALGVALLAALHVLRSVP